MAGFLLSVDSDFSHVRYEGMCFAFGEWSHLDGIHQHFCMRDPPLPFDLHVDSSGYLVVQLQFCLSSPACNLHQITLIDAYI